MNRKILVIDDEENNLEIIEGFLKFGPVKEWEIIKCKNALEGYDVLIENLNNIDVILLDRMMPRMSGIDFLKKIKAEHN